jgi:phage baseplate assembly protein V
MRESTAGVVIGQVTTTQDPDHLGKIEVYFPWLGENSPRRWCSMASIMAGQETGAFFMPVVGDEVLVAFQNGDWDHGFIVGCVWNPVQPPPSADDRQRMIRSKNGHTIRFVDSTAVGGNRGALIVEDGHGNTVTLTNGVVSINSRGHLDLRGSTMSIMGRPVNPIGTAI